MAEKDIGPHKETRPGPDPTSLTTDQLMRQIAWLRALMESQFDVVTTRFDGMDKAIALIQAKADKVPSDVDLAVGRLQELHDERFRSVDALRSAMEKGVETQFRERDTRIEQAAKESKVAVDAAFSAQKEAVSEQNKASASAIAKSEAATTKQIDAIGVNINTTTNGLNDKIEDLKTRVSSVEAGANGTRGRATGVSEGWGLAIGGFGIIGMLITIAVAILMHKGGP